MGLLTHSLKKFFFNTQPERWEHPSHGCGWLRLHGSKRGSRKRPALVGSPAVPLIGRFLVNKI